MAIPKSHRSGGPRTAAGLRAVAGNALRTGAYAAQVVLPGENPAHFQDLEQAFLNDFAPADIAEATATSQSAVSHQLRTLKQSHLVKFRRDGRNILYSLADDHVYTMLNQGMSHICE